MQVRIIILIEDFTEWEQAVNDTINELEKDGNKVASVAWRDNFAAIAYMTRDDLEEAMAARKGLAGDLINDTMNRALGR